MFTDLESEIIHVCVVLMQEKILLDPMFEVPDSDITHVIINEDVIKGDKPAQYLHSPGGTTFDEEDSGFEDEDVSAPHKHVNVN